MDNSVLSNKVAIKTFYLLLVQILKPMIVHVVRIIRKETYNTSLYTHSVFMYRIFYDIGFLLMNLRYLTDTSNFKSKQYYFNLIPILFEIPLYYFSVRLADERTRKVRFRLIRANIVTEEQNDEMWSTDSTFAWEDEDEDKKEDMLDEVQQD